MVSLAYVALHTQSGSVFRSAIHWFVSALRGVYLLVLCNFRMDQGEESE